MSDTHYFLLQITEEYMIETIRLNNGIEMPLEGFGVFQVPDGDVCRKAVSDAISTGYRLIDTAAAYMNEEAVGQAIRESGVNRADLGPMTTSTSPFMARRYWS